MDCNETKLTETLLKSAVPMKGHGTVFVYFFYLVTTSYHKILHSHELARHFHKLIIKLWYEIPRCGNEMLSHGNKILTFGHKIVSGYHKILNSCFHSYPSLI